MDFELSEDQKMLKTMVRDFVTKEVKTIAAHRYPRASSWHFVTQASLDLKNTSE